MRRVQHNKLATEAGNLMRVVILYLKQHPSRCNSHVVKCQNQHAPKEISGIPVIRADGRPIDRLVRCDFLLVFYGDVTSGWNRCPFISRQSHWNPNSQQKITRTTPRSIQWAACATRQKNTSLCSATYVHWQCGTARIRPPHAATAAIDWYLPAGPQQQTCSSEFAAVDPCWDTHNDGHCVVS